MMLLILEKHMSNGVFEFVLLSLLHIKESSIVCDYVRLDFAA